MRSFLQESRYALLRMKPNNRQAWMSFIVAAYLAKDYETALKGLSEYKRPLIQNPDANSAELFELQQFEVRLHEESGSLDKAIESATDSNCPYLDQTVLHETLGRLYFKQGKLDEAAKEYEELIKRNPEQGKYYQNLEECRGLTKPGKENERLQLYENVAALEKKMLVPKVAPLEFIEGEEFVKRLISYLVDGLRTGLPSLFQTIRPLYNNPVKVKVIHNILGVLVEKYEKEGLDVCFDGEI